MDTEFAVSFPENCDPAFSAAAAAAAFAEVDRLESLLTCFSDTSDVAVIRALTPGEVAVVAPETMAILVESATVCAATAGAFDPTVGPIMARLRKNASAWSSIPPEERDALFAQGGLQRLILDTEHLRVAVTPDRNGRATPLELDFGGIGKGYAVDVCRLLLQSEQYGCTDFLIDAGSSTVWAQGTPSPEAPGWPLGVGGVWKGRTRRPTVVTLSGRALSGSGFEIQGAHVADVRRHEAARRWAQSWTLSDSATRADALSTAALALDPRELAHAAATLRAGILVACDQKPFLDRFRDPLRRFGEFT